MGIQSTLNRIVQDLSNAVEDAQKGDDGNTSACRRVRKTAMQASKDLKELRELALTQMKKD
jgi:hypothetical protein